MRTVMDLKQHIRSIPDFPKPGILFRDISTLLRDADAWQVALGRLAKAVAPARPDLLAGVESRGFLLAAPLASKLGRCATPSSTARTACTSSRMRCRPDSASW